MVIVRVDLYASTVNAAAAMSATTRPVRAIAVMPAEPTAMEPAQTIASVQGGWFAWAGPAAAATSATTRRVRATAVMPAGPAAMERARRMTIVQGAWCAWEEPAVAARHATTRRVRATAVMPAAAQHALAATAVTTPRAPATISAHVWGPVPARRVPATIPAPANSFLRRHADVECC